MKIKTTKMKTFFCFFLMVMLGAGISGCATHSLNAPCPNFGSSCLKIPVNSWNDSRS